MFVGRANIFTPVLLEMKASQAFPVLDEGQGSQEALGARDTMTLVCPCPSAVVRHARRSLEKVSEGELL